MDRHGNLGDHKEQDSSDHARADGHPSAHSGWYVTPDMPTLEQDVEQARARFVAWIRWFMDRGWRLTTPPRDKAPTQRTLAKDLGFSGHGGLSMLLNPNNPRAPDFKTLVAARRLLGLPFDVILRTDPPADE
jgi:hypothetical protein